MQKLSSENSGGHEERHARAQFAQQTANGRSDDKAKSEGRSHVAEHLGAIFRRGDVGQIGVGDHVGCTTQAGDGAANEQPEHAGGEGHDDVVDGQAADRQQQEGSAAVGIGEIAEGWPGKKLHGAIGEEQPATQHRSASDIGVAHLLDKLRQHRHDQTEARHVDEYGDEDEPDRGATGLGAGHDGVPWARFYRLARSRSTGTAGVIVSAGDQWDCLLRGR